MINLIEGICYLYPHKEELNCSSLAMKGVWRTCLKLLKEKDTFLTPLLIDNIKREGYITFQTVDDILQKTINKKEVDLPWFGKEILEGDIAYQYGNLGCKLFDSIYHKKVLNAIMITGEDWTWTSINPISFKVQQAGMLLDLWKEMSSHISFSVLANNKKESSEINRNRVRDNFLKHFKHQWINDKGEVVEITQPIYKRQKIQHEVI